MATFEDYSLLKQSEKQISVKVELLDANFDVIGQLDGTLISDSYTINAASFIRKTANLSFIVKDDSLIVGENNLLWFNRFIHIYTGIYSMGKQSVVWYSRGIYTWNTATYNYNATTRNLEISCLDVGACLTSDRGSQISAEGITIEAGTPIREALINTLTQLGHIKKYRIDDIEETIPYDLEFNVGAYVSDILTNINGLYTGYEMFFDDDVFVYQRYPTYKSDPVVLEADVIDDIVISESMNVDFSKIKNVTEVWGTTVESDYYSVDCVLDGNTYIVDYGEDIVGYLDGTNFGFVVNESSPQNVRISIDNGEHSYPVVGENNIPLEAGRLMADKSYVFKYRDSDHVFYFLGESQIVGVCYLVSRDPKDIEVSTLSGDIVSLYEYNLHHGVTSNVRYTIDPTSPFCMDKIGEIRQVFADNNFAAIYTEELATQRAAYENWKTTIWLNTISLNIVDVPWLTVNQKIEYRSQTNKEINTYLISNISTSSSGTMTLSATVFQPEYSWTD